MKLLRMAVTTVAVLSSSFAHGQGTNPVRVGLNIEKVTPTEYGFNVSVSVKNVGATPVSLPVTGLDDSTLQSLGVEQWDEDLGWQSVGPCYDVPPGKTMALAPGQTFTDEVPIGDLAHGFVSTPCPRQIQNLKGSIRAFLWCAFKSDREFQNRMKVRVPCTPFYSAPFHLPDDAVRALALTGDGPIETVKPIYPMAAKKAGVHGTVSLEVVVAENGAVEKATATSGPQMLRKAAAQAVRQWRYKPVIRDGKPVKREETVRVKFVLPKDGKALADKK